MTTSLSYEPHNGVKPDFKGQTRLHEARAAGSKRIVAQVGRRWGKGRFAIGDLSQCYQTALQLKRGEDLVPPFHAGIIVQAYPQGRQAWHEVMSLIPSAWVERRQPAEYMWWLKDLTGNWGGRAGLIEMKSAFDAQSLQGFGLDYLWITEAQNIDDEAFEIVLPTTRSPKTLGWQYFEGIPALYPDHWFQRAYDEATRSTEHFAFHATAFDNPLLSEDHRKEIDSDREVLSATTWERLYLAKYSPNAGFFRNIDQCISGDILYGPVPGSKYVAGLDPGWTNDPSVMIMMDMDQRKIVAHWEWDGSVSWVQTREHIRNIHREWNIQTLIFDATSGGGKAVEQDLMETELPVAPYAIVGVKRMEMLERLAGAIDRGTIAYPPVRPLLRQLRAMQQRRYGDGYRVAVPSGEHDDYIFALALALMACAEAQPITNGIRSHSRRYIQTQAEASGSRPMAREGSRMMRERKLEGIRARAAVAGVD